MFRILSIDGGGIKGAFPAAFLSALEQDFGGPIVDCFDLIAGTSTGGIIALGLGLGLSPKQLLEFYKANAHSIFPGAQSMPSRIKHYFRPKYRPDPLNTALRLAFGSKLLGDSQKRLVIPSFSARSGKIYIYKTPHHDRFQSDWRVPAVEVGMATAAAPSYFPPYIGPTHSAHLDGGIWANNPTGYAVVEAVGILKVQPKEIRVLSLGTTCTAQSFNLQRIGKFGWCKKALDAALSGQSFGSMGIAAVLIGHSNIQRVDPVVAEGRFSIDDTRTIFDLEGLARELARDELPRFRYLFDHGLSEHFKPFYGPMSKSLLG